MDHAHSERSEQDSACALAERFDAAGDWASAAAAWQGYRVRAPDDSTGYVKGAIAFKRLGRLKEACEVLEEALKRFPESEWVAMEHAWTLIDLGRFAEAARRWQNIRQRFPKTLIPYLGEALSLRRGGQPADADRLYQEAIERFPPQDSLYVDSAWCAEEQGDTAESIRRWQRVREHFPQMQVAYVREGTLLRDAGRFEEADALLQQAIERFPDNAEAAMSWAWVAHHQKHWPAALKRWEHVVVRFPQQPEGRCGAAEALMALGRYAEAANIIIPAARLFPDHFQTARLHIQATAHADPAQAVAAWRALRDRFPGALDAWRDYAAALARAGLIEEADTTLLECSERFPDAQTLVIDLAQLADERQDWDTAAARWLRATERCPDLPMAAAGLGSSLLRAGKFNEAEAAFRAARERFGDHAAIASAEASAHEQLRIWPRAIDLWSQLSLRHSGDPAALVGLARTLRESGDPVSAARVAREALERFPDHLEIQIQLALALGSPDDWQQGVEIWELLRERHPTDHLLATSAYRLMEAARTDREELFAAPEQPAFDPVKAAGEAGGLTALFRRFESLGDDCEFGLVQRIFQADTPGLLRWGRTLTDALLRALACEFDGVGEPIHTVVRIQGSEYMTEDRRFEMVSHTFTPPSTVPLEQFAAEQCRRLQWLRKKLIADLHSARKIFVCKAEVATNEAILAVYRALLQYSPRNRLLFACLASPEHPPGTLRRVNDQLFVGYVDRFSTVDISITSWVQICRAMAEQVDRGTVSAAAVPT